MISDNDLEREYRIVVRTIPRSRSARSAHHYEEQVQNEARTKVPSPLVGSVSIRVLYFHTARNPVDVDNLLKTVLDGLKEAAYEDDSQVDHVEIERFQMSAGFIRADYFVRIGLEWILDPLYQALESQQPFLVIIVRSRRIEGLI